MPIRGVVSLVRVLFCVSGAASLVDEVLWARALQAALGGTHRTEALVLGTFFIAIPLGAALASRWLRKSTSASQLWRWYALCEILTAVATLAPLGLARGWALGTTSELVHAYLSLAALCVPAAAVGAVWPLAVGLTRTAGGQLGPLYAFNTFGSAFGALLASFVLLENCGTSGGLAISALASCMLALTAFVFSRVDRRTLAFTETSAGTSSVLDERVVVGIGIAAGFLTVGFEVLGTRLLALRIPTTTYTLGLVLAVQLVGMALGAWFVPRLVNGGTRVLVAVFALALVGIAWAPTWISAQPVLEESPSWVDSLWATGTIASSAFGAGAVMLGILFPLASALLSQQRPGNVHELGKLTAWNGCAGGAGALCAGILLVPRFGVGSSYGLLIALGGIVCTVAAIRVWGVRASALGVLVAAVAYWTMANFVPLRIANGETVVAEIEGPMGLAAVIDDPSGRRRMVVNGTHTLGDNLSASVARRFGLLPALLRPSPQRTLFVGLGTGISKGAAQEVSAVSGGTIEAAELMPEVADLSSYFSAWQGKLGGPGVLRVDDGRSVLKSTRTPFDLVIFDVFLPWHPGTAYLYTRETFKSVHAHLTNDGLFALWLPIYQLSPESLGTIIRTFTSEFPEAHAFAGGVDPARQVVALTSRGTLDPASDFASSLLRAGVRLCPILSDPDALAALDLGGAAELLRALDEKGIVQSSRIQTEDLPWVEFEGAQARDSGRRIRGREFLQILEVSDALRGAEILRGLAGAIRVAWRGSDADRKLFMQSLARKGAAIR
jgi:spermidine synthase